MPRDIILEKAFSGVMSIYSTSFSGKKNTSPVVVFGEVGTNFVTVTLPSYSFILFVTKPMI